MIVEKFNCYNKFFYFTLEEGIGSEVSVDNSNSFPVGVFDLIDGKASFAIVLIDCDLIAYVNGHCFNFFDGSYELSYKHDLVDRKTKCSFWNERERVDLIYETWWTKASRNGLFALVDKEDSDEDICAYAIFLKKNIMARSGLVDRLLKNFNRVNGK